MARPSRAEQAPDHGSGGRGLILVVDREPVYLAGLQAILAASGFAVESCDGPSCVSRVAVGDVQGLVLDARLGPGDYAAGLVSELRAAAPGLSVALVVGSLRGPGLVGVLEAGAGALLHRRCTSDELVAAVAAVVAGRNWVARPLAAPLQEELLAGAEGTQSESLTPRERDVLARLVTGGTNAAIGRQLGISEHTVRNHVRSIMAKLGVANRTDAVATAARRGLVDLS